MSRNIEDKIKKYYRKVSYMCVAGRAKVRQEVDLRQTF
jgi:hypothetical protein